MLGSTGEHASLHFSALLANASFDARCCEDETPFKITHQNGQQVQKGGGAEYTGYTGCTAVRSDAQCKLARRRRRFLGGFVCVKTNRTVAPLKQGTMAQVPPAEQVSQLQ